MNTAPPRTRSAAGVSRRCLLLGALTAPWLSAGCATSAALSPRLVSQLKSIEAGTGGRLGIAALDSASGRLLGYNTAQRFAMCSTFKLPLAAMVLVQVQAGRLTLDQQVPFSRADLVPHAPVVSAHLSQGALSVSALCEAVVVVSDNVAANLLLSLVGGPEGMTAWMRGLGDPVTRLDRIEPDLNSNLPDDERDTTTPQAMAQLVRSLLVGGLLQAPNRDLLTRWLIDSRTGLNRLRAGLPADWKAGDKTGTGERGAVNDVAIVWPPGGRAPWLVASYLSGSTQPTTSLETAHREAMRALVAEMSDG